MPAETKPKDVRALSPLQDFDNQLDKMKSEFAKMLPSHVPVDRFIRVLRTQAQLRPDTASADRRILFGEIMKCAQDGLVPDGREAVINTYRSKDGPPTPKYIPMVGGICKKARNSGEISTIDSQVVYENDNYESWTDEKGQHFKHAKARKERGEAILTYAYAITKDGGFYFEEVDEDQMKAIEASSRAKEGPWKGPFKDEMRRKSAIRRLAKYRLPSSADLEQVIERDNDLFDLDPKKEDPKPAEATSSRLSRLVEEKNTPAPSTAAVEAEVVEDEIADEHIPI
jgi:recombination protein RecT